MYLSRLLGIALGRLFILYYRTLRIRALMGDGSVIHPRDFPYDREIFAISERDVIAYIGSMVGFTVLVAHGRDGDWVAAGLETIGCVVVRGSSRRGGARALAGLIRSLKARRRPGGLVIDGPLGPLGEAKPGIAFCALQTGRPLRAVSAAAARAVVFAKAWSQIYVPLPFSRVVMYVDDPIPLPDPDAEDAVEELTRELNRRLAHARSQAIEALRQDVDLRPSPVRL